MLEQLPLWEAYPPWNAHLNDAHPNKIDYVRYQRMHNPTTDISILDDTTGTRAFYYAVCLHFPNDDDAQWKKVMPAWWEHLPDDPKEAAADKFYLETLRYDQLSSRWMSVGGCRLL